jgi:hypothetical protein
VYSATFLSEVIRNSGEGKICETRRGKILHDAPQNKLSDTIYTETSYWTDEEIQRMSCDVHSLVVRT